MTTLGLFMGTAGALSMLWVVRNKGWDRSAWSLFMMTLPIWYALFGLLAMDASIIATELFYGLPYLLIGFLAWRFASRSWLLIAGLVWLSHAFYDVYHDVFFVNPGVFAWYPTACLVFDLMVGAYLIYIVATYEARDGASYSC